VIVTFNIKDFPTNVLKPFGIASAVPDTFASQLMESGIVVAAAAEHRAALKRPPLSPTEYLDALRRNGLPGTADAFSTDAL